MLYPLSYGRIIKSNKNYYSGLQLSFQLNLFKDEINQIDFNSAIIYLGLFSQQLGENKGKFIKVFDLTFTDHLGSIKVKMIYLMDIRRNRYEFNSNSY